MASWLIALPQSLASDDAFFFSRGLQRFSVLDFSPHFPGYPGFILIGRLFKQIIPEPVAALQAMTIAFSLAIPPAAAWIGLRWKLRASLVLAVFVVTLTQPLLPFLAVSGLSDGAGILFILLFIALLSGSPGPSRWQFLLSGVFLGMAAIARPSLLPVLTAAYATAILAAPRAALPIAAGELFCVVPALLFLYANEGWFYLQEAERFLIGHTLVWGNTAFSQGRTSKGWLDVLLDNPWLGLLLFLYGAAALCGVKAWTALQPAQKTCLVAFVAAVIWTWTMQNPESLRHLAPIMELGAILLPAVGLSVKVAMIGLLLAAGLNVAVFARNGTLATEQVAPLTAAARHLKALSTDGLVLTNRGVRFLRDRLAAFRVYDLAYPASAGSALREARIPVHRLSSQHIDGCVPQSVLRARMPGETSLYLYQLAPRGDCLWRPSRGP